MADAVDAQVDVLNLSLGCYTADWKPPFVLERAVDVVAGHGIPVICAAGNHGGGNGPVGIGPGALIFPAACARAIAVGAHERGVTGVYKAAELSPKAPWVQLGAPGVRVASTYLDGMVEFNKIAGLPDPPQSPQLFDGYAVWGGTSFAAAIISGEIARLMTQSNMSATDAVATLLLDDPDKHNGIGKYTP